MPTETVHTLYLPGNEWPAVGRSTTWVGAAERAELLMLTDERRRNEWLAGRWVAKQLLIQAGMAEGPADIEICSRDVRRRGSRPRIQVAGRPVGNTLSIAHTSKGTIAALAASEQQLVGVDLVDLADVAALFAKRRGRGFARLWFTPLERCWIAMDRTRRTATLWGIKEAIYKACQLGEGWKPRDVVVWPRAGGGYRCQYRGRTIDGLQLEVEQIDGQLAVVASVVPGAQQQTDAFGNSLQHELILGQAS
jgi:phosphopantetheinyl transferase (holo-ACP synthase)